MRNEIATIDFDTLFPDKREQGETRLRQCQLVMLRMFKIFDYLCTKHDVKYFLIAGTLLGAIRHKGFIPWDDDMDVGMTRKEHEKFEKLVVPELPHDIFYQSPETDPYFPSCYKGEAKLRDKYSTYMSRNPVNPPKWQNGLMMDIVVFDRAYLPHNFFIYALNLLTIKMFWAKKANNKGNKKRAKVLKAISKYTPFGLVYSSIFIQKWSQVKELGANYFTRKEIEELERVPFEGISASIPKGWRPYLTRKFGDYMKPPPDAEKEKKAHGGSVPDPFTASKHTQVLHWSDRKRPSVEK